MHEKAASRRTRRRSGNLPIQRTTRGVICDSCQESSVQRFGMRASSGLTAFRSLFENCASENSSSAQGRVEAVERHRTYQENSRQTDARIPRRTLGRQWEMLEDTENHVISDQRK